MNRSKIKALSWIQLDRQELEGIDIETKDYVVLAYVYNYDVQGGKEEGEKEPLLIMQFYSIHSESTRAEFRVFLTHTDYITEYCDVSTGFKSKWKTGRLERILDFHWYKKSVCLNEKSNEEIQNFFDVNTDNCDALLLVDEHQQEITAQKLWKKHREEEAKIDKELEGIPELPEGVEEWVEIDMMAKSRYIYYTYETGKKIQEGHCTHCHVDVDVKPRNNQKGVCPHCESEVIYKARKKSALVIDDANFAVIQQWKEGFIIRYLNLSKYYKNPRSPDIKVHESYREYYEGDKLSEVYEWREHPSNKKVRWYRGSLKFYYGNCFVYPKGIKEAMEGTGFQYSALDIHAEQNENWANPYQYLHRYTQHNCIEYLTKLGFSNMVNRLVHHVPYNIPVNLKGDNLSEILGVKKDKIPLLQELNVTEEEVGVVQEIEKEGLHMTAEDLRWYLHNLGTYSAKNLIQYISTKKEKKLGTPSKIKKYLLSHQTDLHLTYQLWVDYIRFAQDLNYPLDKEFLAFPRNVQNAHDLTEKRWTEQQNERRKENRRRMEEESVDLLKSQQEQYNYENDSYFIMAPEKLFDIVREGAMLRHCVGTYLEKVAEKRTVILFLRRKQEPEKPFFTIEVTGGKVMQCYGLSNSKPNFRVQNFLDEFTKNKVYKNTDRVSVLERV